MINLLMVDDEINILKIMTEYCKAIGLDVNSHIATDAESAFQIINNNEIHLAFLDILMPHIGGFEILESLQKNYPQCEAYIWSGMGTSDMISASKCHGAKGFIEKPFRPKEIANIISEFIEKQEKAGLPFTPQMGDAKKKQIISNCSRYLGRI